MRSLQPAGDLLGRPIQSELFRNAPPQPRIARQFTTFRTTSAVPGLRIGRRRAVTIIAAIAAETDGRLPSVLGFTAEAVLICFRSLLLRGRFRFELSALHQLLCEQAKLVAASGAATPHEANLSYRVMAEQWSGDEVCAQKQAGIDRERRPNPLAAVSALSPIATELVRRNELTRCAIYERRPRAIAGRARNNRRISLSLRRLIAVDWLVRVQPSEVCYRLFGSCTT
jgi:hypothetical protein